MENENWYNMEAVLSKVGEKSCFKVARLHRLGVRKWTRRSLLVQDCYLATFCDLTLAKKS